MSLKSLIFSAWRRSIISDMSSALSGMELGICERESGIVEKNYDLIILWYQMFFWIANISNVLCKDRKCLRKLSTKNTILQGNIYFIHNLTTRKSDYYLRTLFFNITDYDTFHRKNSKLPGTLRAYFWWYRNKRGCIRNRGSGSRSIESFYAGRSSRTSKGKIGGTTRNQV